MEITPESREKARNWMEKHNISLWVNPHKISRQPQAHYSSKPIEVEELLQKVVNHYVQLQLDNPEELEERLRGAWRRLLEKKDCELLIEEANKLGISL